MGLDSIELLMEVENYFKIQIPDTVAEKITTVQIMVDTIAIYLNITSDERKLQNEIFSKISDCILKTNTSASQIMMSDLISTYLSPIEKDNWHTFQVLLGLDVPKPEIINTTSKKFSDKLKKLINWTPMYDWKEITVENFTNAICANNYQTLLNQNNIICKHEIYIGVMGITADKIGVEYYEILPEKSFTSDLGID